MTCTPLTDPLRHLLNRLAGGRVALTGAGAYHAGEISSVGMAWAEFDDVAIEITPTRWRSWSSEALYAVGREASGDMPSSEWWRGED
jgi:hypothetical protein